MDNASVNALTVATSQEDGDASLDVVDPQSEETSSRTVHSDCVWEGVHRPLPTHQPRWWGEWAF